MNNFKEISKPFIVAEIGNNHEGSIKNAIKLIEAAKISGADAVKFQIFNPYKFVSRKDKKRILQLKKFALKKADILKLKKKCDELNIIFFATPLDIESAKFLNKIQKIFKISSGDNNYIDLLKKVRAFKKPVIISTGLMNYEDVNGLVNFFKNNSFYKNKHNICLMHCVSSYPATKNNINLNSITFLKKKFPNVTIGYSDHTIGYKIATTAFNLGAEIIEKHFTLSNNFSNFRDHKISLNPKSFSNFVKEIRFLKKIRGNFEKKMNVDEIKNYSLMRRKIILNTNLKTGTKIKRENISILRSSEKGIFASDINKVIGKTLINNIKKFENLLFDDLKK